MGAIYDRSKEHLGASDAAVIAGRRFLIDAVRALQAGSDPPHVLRDPTRNRFPQIDTLAEIVEGDWRDHFPHLQECAVIA
jgi:hypothetical protein